ncbi:transporter substrate-binding domain-containing protein [Opitutus sp. GAS368]|jgi:putative glutamine transport system substrate-binding protein|uniref:transporter substrate-binding domain-containing protein n=1 Tax=Opitutus sp. GAS368 TaxID=1882749 RepID=UPI000B89521A|nr:transporter substrate-binding domain-containing protein [Opitutus sp. GAS368]
MAGFKQTLLQDQAVTANVRVSTQQAHRAGSQKGKALPILLPLPTEDEFGNLNANSDSVHWSFRFRRMMVCALAIVALNPGSPCLRSAAYRSSNATKSNHESRTRTRCSNLPPKNMTAHLTLQRFLVTAALLLSVPVGTLQAEAPTLTIIRQHGVLRIGNEMVFPRLNFKNPTTGENEGFMADLARALARRILGDEKKVEFVLTNDETRFEDLQRGAFDVLIDTTPSNLEKVKVADFSGESFRAGSALLVKRGSPIKTIDDIKPDTRVAFVTANPDIKLIKEKAPRAVYLQFENDEDAVKALVNGQADVFTQVVTHLYAAATTNPGYVPTGRFTTKFYRIAYPKGDTEFGAYLNDFLKQMRDSGEYDRLFDKWFSAYGGNTVR